MRLREKRGQRQGTFLRESLTTAMISGSLRLVFPAEP